ncbi:hypothetical protein FJ434_07090 [Mesorhizobium sp. B2-5-13]|uniref:hypothetical protein n=1 Tax=unclassified Mesorhizobium TaxID=325217 RepID=UPI00112B6C55|nr:MULTISPECIES: hypothetical protein [unclassified Mesorhizobium]TPJ44245.1 hypothetical protein FJ432_04360 [Mesorhizobium sp. B2-6-5]TPJ90752.1 hypothetical protein FJ434_07090 [Mesorhizobium sp. B2-5-13]TPK54615.1 hypothetical protein FJ560_01385 [Mesorhizobium sp. B2-5-5]
MTARAAPIAYLVAALRARVKGPGGYYNSGNALGIVVGVAIQIATVPVGLHEGSAVTTAVMNCFAGSHGSVSLALATLVFFLGGEAYHRAWSGPDAPDPALNRLGDFLSGIGALGLGAALLLLGDPLLAATSGLLHALGKFGSAIHGTGTPLPLWPVAWPDPFRSAVLASRLPAMLATTVALGGTFPRVWSGESFAALAMQLTLLGCYLLWTKADLLLLGARSKALREISTR